MIRIRSGEKTGSNENESRWVVEIFLHAFEVEYGSGLLFVVIDEGHDGGLFGEDEV